MCDLPSCYTSSTPLARKRHKCCECRGWIEPGEKYHRFSGIWDGEAGTFKTCDDCQTLRREVEKALELAYDEPIPFGLLREDLGGLQDTLRFVGIMEKRGAVIHESWRRRIEIEQAKEPGAA